MHSFIGPHLIARGHSLGSELTLMLTGMQLKLKYIGKNVTLKCNVKGLGYLVT